MSDSASAGPFWKNEPYSLKVTHDGKEWMIQFFATTGSKELLDTITRPGWYTPEEIKLQIENFDKPNMCTNMSAAVHFLPQIRKLGITNNGFDFTISAIGSMLD